MCCVLFMCVDCVCLFIACLLVFVCRVCLLVWFVCLFVGLCVFVRFYCLFSVSVFSDCV